MLTNITSIRACFFSGHAEGTERRHMFSSGIKLQSPLFIGRFLARWVVLPAIVVFYRYVNDHRFFKQSKQQRDVPTHPRHGYINMPPLDFKLQLRADFLRQLCFLLSN